MLPRDEFFSYSTLIKIRVRCYQPPCHNCFHLSIVFKFVAATVCFSAGNRWLSPGDEVGWYNHKQCMCFSYRITHHADLFCDRCLYITQGELVVLCLITLHTMRRYVLQVLFH